MKLEEKMKKAMTYLVIAGIAVAVVAVTCRSEKVHDVVCGKQASE